MSSTTIDQRVVEMQFDNKQFESNVKTTMSTLDKLKQSLNLSGASTGLDKLSSAASNINMSPLAKAVDTVSSKFSALEVMGITALANITNSAVNAGKRIVESLTIEPITTGFNEYELKMDSVKTIMASTGESVETVNAYLEELNEYSDQTIYSFADMTQNIGKFTNAGVKLEDAVLAIKGISNEAALSGANANEASRAMYNFAQALSVGYIQRIDWKSIEIANMATMEFKEQLLDAAIQMGTVTKNAEGMYSTLAHPDEIYNASAMFTETLDDQWLTTDVLIKTLKDYSDATTDIGSRAFAAAQDVTKFTQMMDVLKETAQSGWAKTWEILVGNIETAKSIFTPLTDFFSGIIDGISDFRNNLLEGALGKPLSSLAEKIEKVTTVTEKMTETTQDYSDIINKIINGEFGTGQERWDALAEAGYDWAYAQNLVNEQLGSSVRHATTFTEVQKDLIETQGTTIDQLVKMSDAQLKELNFTEQEIQALRNLEEQSRKTGVPLKELVKDMGQLDGRTLLINSFKNAGTALVSVIKAIRDAWVDVFPPMQSYQLYNIISALHDFSTELLSVQGRTDEIKRTFKGLFALIDIITTLVNGAFKFGFELLDTVLGYFNMDILDLTANIGDAIVYFRDFIDNSLDFKTVLDAVIPFIDKLIKHIKSFITNFKDLDGVPDYIIEGLVNGLKDGAKKVWDAAKEIAMSLWTSFCEFMGIESPSKKMIEAGQYIIEGLVKGVKDGASTVWDTLKELGKGFMERVSEIDFGAILAAGVMAGFLMLGKRLLDTVDNITAPIDGVNDVLNSTSKAIKSFSLGIKSQALLNIAISLAVLAGSIALLGYLDIVKVRQGLGIMVVLAGVLAGLTIAIGKFGPTEAAELGKFSVYLLGVSASLYLISTALKQLSNLGVKQLIKSGIAIAAIAGVITGLIAATKLFNANAIGIGTSLLAISASLLILTLVIKQLAGLNGSAIFKGLIVITAFGGIITGLIAATKLAGPYATNIGSNLLKISGSILLMVFVAKLISTMNEKDLKKGMSYIIQFGGIVAGLIAITRLAGGNRLDNVGSTLLSMAASMLLMAFVVKLLGKIDSETILKGLVTITAFGGIITGLIAATKLAGNKIKRLGVTLISMSVAIGILAGVTALLGMVKVKNLIKGVIATGFLSAMMTMMISATKNAKQCHKNLIIMTVTITMLAAAVIALSFIDPKKIAVASGAVSMLMGMFALLMTSTKFVKNSKQTQTTIGIMLGVVAGLAAIVAALSLLPNVDSVMNTTLALSVLLGSFAASMVILGKVGRISTTVNKTLLPLLGVVAGLATILGLMSAFKVEGSIKSAAAISILLTTMAASLIVLGYVSPLAKASLGSLAIMGLIVAEIAVILGVMNHFNINPSIETAAALSVLLLSLSASLIVVSAAGFLATGAVTGILAMVGFVTAIGGLVTAIGYLSDKYPQLEEFFNKGLPILEKIGYALGSFVGNIFGGFTAGISSGFIEIGENLSAFMDSASGFIEGSKNIDASAMTGIKALAESILILTAADVLDGLAVFSGKSSLADFGKELAEFGPYFKQYANSIAGIDGETVAKSADAAKALAEFASAIPNEGGVLAEWIGDNTLESFGSALARFGPYLAAYAKSVSGIDTDIIEKSGAAASTLAEFASALPNDGGVISEWIGDNKLDDFGSMLVKFGPKLKSYSDSISGIDTDLVEKSGTAASSLAEFADNLPNDGGIIAEWIGDNKLENFGSMLVKFGPHLKSYADSISGIEPDVVSKSASAAKALAEFADNLPNSGGLVSFFTGENDMDVFGTSLVTFGAKFKSYAGYISGIDSSVISTTTSAAKSIVSLANDLPDSGLFSSSTSLSAFGEEMADFGAKIYDYYDNVKLIEAGKLTGLMTELSGIVSIAKDISSINSGSLSSFGEALTSLGKESASLFTTAVTEETESKYPDFLEIGKEYTNNISTGITDKKTNVSDNALTVISNSITSIRGKYTDFHSAGSYLVDGLINGISAKTSSATAMATQLANSVATATRTGLDINSPSRVAYEIGQYYVQGFVNAVSDSSSAVSDAGLGMADYARDSLSGAISKITELMDSDMDVEPTIRPIIDLSNVQNGVNSINSMLSREHAVNINDNYRRKTTNSYEETQSTASMIDKWSSKLSDQLSASMGMGSVPVNVHVVLEGDSAKIFKVVQAENTRYIKQTGYSPLAP